MPSLYKVLQQKRSDLNAQYDAITERAASEERGLSDDERTTLDSLLAQNKALDADLAREAERRARDLVAPAVLKLPRGDSEQAVVANYLRTGDPSGLHLQAAYNDTDMNVTTAADGQVIVPTGMYNGIIAKRDEAILYPRLGVRPIPGKGTTVNVPIDNEADLLFASVAESGDVLRDSPALTQKAFTLVKYGKFITLTWELLRDEDANLLAFVNDWIGRGIAATENDLLVTEADTNGTAGLTLDSATAIGAAEIPELVGKLAPEYQDGAQFILHPTTYAYLQGLAGQNNWYFANGLGQPNQRSLWGFPANLTSYATAYAASAKSLIFGNFGFMGRRQGTTIQMLRDPYTAAGSGQVKLWFWFDAVYGVLQAEAIQYATHPTG